jgi:hypothetical protein
MRRSGDSRSGGWKNQDYENRFSRRGGFSGSGDDESRRERARESGSTRGDEGGGFDFERERWESGAGQRGSHGSEHGYGSAGYQGSGRAEYRSGGIGWGASSEDFDRSRGSFEGSRRSEGFGSTSSGEGGYGGSSWSDYRGGGARGFGGYGSQSGSYGGSQSGGSGSRRFGAGSRGEAGRGEAWDRSGSEWAGGEGSSGGYGYGGSYGRSYGGASGVGGSWRSPAQGTQGGQPRSDRRKRTPKGYTRSDERIREDICDRLSESYTECEEVTVTVTNGEVVLSGRAPSGETRREIERIAEDVTGVKDVTNQIRTRREQGEDDKEQDEPGDGRKSKKGHESSSFTGSSSKKESTKT